MKKIIFPILFVLFFVVFCTYTVYFAYAENVQRVLTTNAELTEKTSQVLAILENNSSSAQTYSTLTTSDSEKYTITSKTNELADKSYYNVKAENYSFNYTSDTLELVNIFNTSNNFSNTDSTPEEDARTFIMDMYTELSLPSDYELTYLEKLDDSLWEADFSKKYGDIYNKFESVKIFFSPDEQEIAALTVFNEKVEETSTLARTSSLTESNARDVVVNTLNISNDKILNTYQSFERANGYYTNESLDLSKNIYNVWVVEYLDSDSNTNSCFVDINTGDIIGGAIQK